MLSLIRCPTEASSRLAGIGCAIAAALFGLPSVSARADDSAGAWFLGNWSGERTKLENSGLDFQFGYTSEVAYNAAGGQAQGARYADQWTFGVTLDLARQLNLHDAQLQLTLTDRNGSNLSADNNLGTLQQVQEVYGRGSFWRFTQFWYRQRYLGQKLDWKVGRMTVGEDFATFACDFQNLSFCGAQPGNIVGDYWYNWPVSQWATRFKINAPSDLYAQVGFYHASRDYLTKPYALNLGSPPGTGTLIPLEFGWSPKLGAAGLQGTYKVGGWYNSSKSNDVYLDIDHNPQVLTGQPPLQHDAAYGGYIVLQQQITRAASGNPERGMSLFLRAAQADRHTASVDSQIAAGLIYVGPFAARAEDALGLAVARTHINSRVADGERLQNANTTSTVPVQTSEYAAELYYSWHLMRGLVLRPNLQYIYHPGGSDQNDDVVILGLKVVANL